MNSIIMAIRRAGRGYVVLYDQFRELPHRSFDGLRADADLGSAGEVRIIRARWYDDCDNRLALDDKDFASRCDRRGG